MNEGPSLAELQRWFKGRVSPSAEGRVSATTVMLNPQRGEPGEARLSVYADGYVVRIREALVEAYGAVRWVLGEPVFARLAESYAHRHPSRHYNLSFAGRHLPEFLASHPLARRLPFLPDLARLEWTVCRAFHAFEEPPLDPARLQAVAPAAWERIRLVFQPSVAVVASAWPIFDIWSSRKKPPKDVDIPVNDRPQQVLVFRRGVEVRCEAIPREAAQALEGLLAGKTLGAVVRETATPPITEWFDRWMRAGLIVNVLEMAPPVC